MIYITKNNQSIFDICMITYGTFDKLSQLCNDNNITIGQNILNGTKITYTNNSIGNSNISTGENLYLSPIYPTITSNPSNCQVCRGSGLIGHMYVSATGSITSYQWQYSSDLYTWINLIDNSELNGSTTNTLNFNDNVDLILNGYYIRCQVTGYDSSFHSVVVNSDYAVLNVGIYTSVTIPTSFTSLEWADINLVSTHIGLPITYQWQYSDDGQITWNNFTSAVLPSTIDPILACTPSNYTTDTLTISNIAKEISGYSVRLAYTNTHSPCSPTGTRYSNICVLNIFSYHTLVEQYHDYIYLAGHPWTHSEFNALVRFVNDLTGVTNGSYATTDILSKFNLIYPMMGSIADTQKINLLGIPGTTNFLSYNGLLTNNSLGIDLQGGYVDTGFSPNGVLADGQMHFSLYSQTDLSAIDTFGGCYSNDSNTIYGTTEISRNVGNMRYTANQVISHSHLIATDTKSFNLTVLDLGNGTTHTQQRSNIYQIGTFASSLQSTNTFKLGKLDSTILGSIYQASFMSVGNSLTTTESLNLYNAVQHMQTILSRNV